MRDLEAHLEDERKQRQTAQSAQKKIESELQDLENQLEAEAKGKEDAQRHYKKLHVSILSSPFLPMSFMCTYTVYSTIRISLHKDISMDMCIILQTSSYE